MNNVATLIAAKPLKELDSAQLALLLTNMAEVPEEKFGSARDIKYAVIMASHLHAGQTRSNRANLPRTPYIEHPLRNTLRLMRWDCVNPDVIIASILHDVVEDCAEGIYELAYGVKPPKDISEEALRDISVQHIRDTFGAEVARVVLAVSNGILPSGVTRAERHVIYREHVRKVIHNDPHVFLVKFSDFVDNAVGLYHNNIQINKKRIAVLAAKYLPMVDIFEAELELLSERLELGPEAVQQISAHLEDARVRLEKLASQEI